MNIMEDDEFMKTNVNMAFVIKFPLDSVKEVKRRVLELTKEFEGRMIYHTVSPYKLNVSKEKEK